MNKPTVFYDPSKGVTIRVGLKAFVYPLNHPDSERVSNKAAVITSRVLNYTPSTGVFETLNTIYKPIRPCQIDSIGSLPMSLTNDNDY